MLEVAFDSRDGVPPTCASMCLLAELMLTYERQQKKHRALAAERGREYPLGRAALGGLGPELKYQHHSALRRAIRALPRAREAALMMR